MQFRDERRTAVIICTGQSAGRIDLEPARRFARIVVNDGHILAPDADVLYACDPRWWNFHGPGVCKSFGGEKFCPDPEIAKRFGIQSIQIERKAGLSRRDGIIFTGGVVGNSGAQAINLAFLFGARRIVLVGMDMGGDHFFGKHPKAMGSTDSGYEGMIRSMAQMAAELHSEGVEIINTSDVSRIGYWPGGKPIPID